MRLRIALFGLVLCVCLAPVMLAQDAAKVDPTHYGYQRQRPGAVHLSRREDGRL